MMAPFFTEGLSKAQRLSKGRRKLHAATEKIRESLSTALEVDIETDATGTASASEEDPLKDLEAFEKVLGELVEKYNAPTTSYALKLQILTLSPYDVKKTVDKFGATAYMVKKARNLKEVHGVLATPDMKRPGASMSDAQKEAVRMFYERDDISRQCPGQKDFISVRDKDGTRHVQKRLILANLREIYEVYKKEVDKPVGFSKFAELRPKWCILAGRSGTHSVCVCLYHQNPKLMLSAVTNDFSVTDLIAKTVCDIESEKCMTRECSDCPDIEIFRTFLTDKLHLSETDDVTFKQWTTQDRTTLVTMTKPVDEFIDELVDKVWNLSRHHFIAKTQGTFLQKLKQDISADECILLGDFSENYSFVVQDAVQGYHWENSQATLHPFVAYYREDNTLISSSFCVLSDSGDHSTSAVYTFQKEVLSLLKTKNGGLKKVHYFTDGASSQYKNKHNFLNMCYHEKDFGLSCVWHFFATCHGKGPCDGVGGTVKRLTARASLQRPEKDQIVTPEHMFKFCKDNIAGITFIFVSTETINAVKEAVLKERFVKARVLRGTRGFHYFEPCDTSHMKAAVTSAGAFRAKVFKIA